MMKSILLTPLLCSYGALFRHGEAGCLCEYEQMG